MQLFVFLAVVGTSLAAPDSIKKRGLPNYGANSIIPYTPDIPNNLLTPGNLQPSFPDKFSTPSNIALKTHLPLQVSYPNTAATSYPYNPLYNGLPYYHQALPQIRLPGGFIPSQIGSIQGLNGGLIPSQYGLPLTGRSNYITLPNGLIPSQFGLQSGIGLQNQLIPTPLGIATGGLQFPGLGGFMPSQLSLPYGVPRIFLIRVVTGRLPPIHQHTTNTFAHPVSVPVPVKVDRPVPYSVPQPVEVKVDAPYNVPVSKPFPVAVDKPYTVNIDKPYPVAVDKPFNIHIEKPYPVAVPHLVPGAIERPGGVVLSAATQLESRPLTLEGQRVPLEDASYGREEQQIVSVERQQLSYIGEGVEESESTYKQPIIVEDNSAENGSVNNETDGEYVK